MNSRTSTLARRVGIVTVTTAIAVGLGACASGGTASGKTTVTFAYLWTAEGAKTVESMIEKFNDSHDDIQVVGVPTDATKQLAAMSASTGTFDVSDNFGADVKSWAAKGILEPLDGYLDAADLADFVPTAMEQMTYEGSTYSMPILLHTSQLISNTDILASAGVAPPTTTDEFYDAIDKLSVVGSDGTIERLGWGFSSEYEPLLLLGWAGGGQWDTDAGPTPDDPKIVAALTEFQNRYVNKYGADRIATLRSGFGDYLSDADPFYTGKLAMVFDGEWHASTAPVHAPNLKWDVNDIPVSSSSLAGTTSLSSSTLFIPRNAQHKKEAATFVQWMLQPQQMVEFSTAMVNLPSRLSVLGDPAYADLTNFGPFLKSLNSPNLKVLGGKPYSAEYQADLTSAFDQILLGTRTATQALADVASRAASYER